MMIEEALLWLTFFSPRHSSNQIEVIKERFHEASSCIKCSSGCQFHVNKWILNSVMLIIVVFEKQDV